MRAIAFAALALAAGAARASDPKTDYLVLDANLKAREQPSWDELSEGDSVVVQVDPTRKYGFDPPELRGKKAAVAAPVDVDANGTMTAHVWPELHHFYVFHSEETGLFMQPGACPPAGQNPPPAFTFRRDEALGCAEEYVSESSPWKPTSAMRVYRCPELSDVPLAERKKQSTAWSLVAVYEGEATCVASWELALEPMLVDAKVLVTRGALPTETVPLVAQQGVFTGTVAMKLAGPTEVTVRAQREKKDAKLLPIGRFRVKPEVTRSLVRIQAEVLATNRLRTIALGVAMTPVTERFFTSGPWNCGGKFWRHFGCTVAPTALLRISGDQTSILQLGFGASVYVTRSFLFNAGVLLGTRDGSTWWDPERNWFVGFAVDPVLLTEARQVR